MVAHIVTNVALQACECAIASSRVLITS